MNTREKKYLARFDHIPTFSIEKATKRHDFLDG